MLVVVRALPVAVVHSAAVGSLPALLVLAFLSPPFAGLYCKSSLTPSHHSDSLGGDNNGRSSSATMLWFFRVLMQSTFVGKNQLLYYLLTLNMVI